jgi:hypothetical protein
MNTRIFDIISKELIPNSIRKTGLNMVFYYYSEWREKRRARRLAEQQEEED